MYLKNYRIRLSIQKCSILELIINLLITMNGHNLIIYNDNIITTTITGSSLHSSCGCCVFIAKRLMRFQLWSKKLLIKYWENDNNIPFSKLNNKNTPNEK
jgi:hypothetical protein